MAALRVLFVDDEVELVSAVSERLRFRNIEAEGVTDGATALARIRAKHFDAVVLDLKMPGLGGLEVLRRMLQFRPELPVLLLTGHGSEDEAAEGVRLGAVDCLQKPVDIANLVSILHSVSHHRESKP